MMIPKRRLLACVSAAAMVANNGAAFAASPLQPNDTNTRTPVKHVIVIYGENRSFDHVFATYKPPSGEFVLNLLSEGIINADGSPGPNFKRATQYKASDTGTYSVSPTKTDPYTTLPPPNTDGAPSAQSDTAPPFKTLVEAANADGGVLPGDLYKLTTGATGLPQDSIDTRIHNVNALPPGPFQLTPGVPYDSYAASPVHRYYQNYQQNDCNAKYATAANPSGCLMDLYPWVEVTVGAGTNGKPQSAGFNDETTGEGATSMGFYNAQQGDQPFFTQLAHEFTISDNYHQPGLGGTGLDSVLAGFADDIWYSDGKGNPATPPSNQIENPDAQKGTNNWYTQDGYSGGSYSACADTSAPGVASVASYLSSLPKKVALNCEQGHYYLLNNYNPGFYANGQPAPLGSDQFTIPPVSTPSIGDDLLAANVSFAWFGEGWNQAAADPSNPKNVYCSICNPFNYQTKFMANDTLRTQVNKDLTDFEADLASGDLPAVSFVKPSGLNDGHPASSKWSIFEAFVKKVLVELRANPKLWSETAVFITVDEGGGYYDSGYIQPLDFFGDSVRIPLIVVSPWSQGGHVNHSYADHVSILKFIEKNWNLPPISNRSRDRLPNPVQAASAPYAPINGPAIDDLLDMFHFGNSHS